MRMSSKKKKKVRSDESNDKEHLHFWIPNGLGAFVCSSTQRIMTGLHVAQTTGKFHYRLID